MTKYAVVRCFKWGCADKLASKWAKNSGFFVKDKVPLKYAAQHPRTPHCKSGPSELKDQIPTD